MFWFLTKKGRDERRLQELDEAERCGYEWARHAFFIEGKSFEEIDSYLHCPFDVTARSRYFDIGAQQAMSDIKDLFSRHPTDNNTWFNSPSREF